MKPSFLFLNDEIASSLRFVVSVLSIKILPVVGLSINPIILSKVDLPDPELPTIRTNSPCSIENETLSNAFTKLSPSP